MSPEEIDDHLAALAWQRANERLRETMERTEIRPLIELVDEWIAKRFDEMATVPTHYFGSRRSGKRAVLTYIYESHILVQPLEDIPVRGSRIFDERLERAMLTIRQIADGGHISGSAQ